MATRLVGQRHLVAWAIWRREVFVALRCQAVEDVNYCVHRLATVATQFAKGAVQLGTSVIGRRQGDSTRRRAKSGQNLGK